MCHQVDNGSKKYKFNVLDELDIALQTPLVKASKHALG